MGAAGGGPMSLDRAARAQPAGRAGWLRRVVHFKSVTPTGWSIPRRSVRRDDAARRRAEIEASLLLPRLDPRRGRDRRPPTGLATGCPRGHDLRATTLGAAGDDDAAPGPAAVRVDAAAADHHRRGTGDGYVTCSRRGCPPPPSARPSFALRQCLAAAVADGRLTINPVAAVPLPTERPRPAR